MKGFSPLAVADLKLIDLQQFGLPHNLANPISPQSFKHSFQPKAGLLERNVTAAATLRADDDAMQCEV